MKKVISASRRTDLVAFFPEWLSSVLRDEKAMIHGPSGHAYMVDLNPENVHTIVLWSKDFSNLLQNQNHLQEHLQKYNQLYFHFTITGLGGTFIEQGVFPPSAAISQLDFLIELARNPERISLRFDPIVFWKEGEELRTNLRFFENLAPKLCNLGIKDVRISFAQWYSKAKRRATKYGFHYVDPPLEVKKKKAKTLSQMAKEWNLRLYSCSQNFLAEIPGISSSSCIDGNLLQRLHPEKEPASVKKDKSQRTECRCTESTDIGSYTQFCPHSCLYCYANPRI